jgi:hypothetical protein
VQSSFFISIFRVIISGTPPWMNLFCKMAFYWGFFIKIGC